MALKLDNNLLEELGLGALPDHEKQLLLRQIYEKLEMNVGVRLADQMSNEQLDEFERFVDSNDDKGAFQWLEGNFPNYKDVVNQEFEKLKAEIKQYAPQMLAVAQQNAQQQMGPAPMSQQGAPMQPGAGAYAQPQPMQPPVYQAPSPGMQPDANMGYGQQQLNAPQQFGPPAGYPAQPGAGAQPSQYPGYPTQQPPAGPPPQQ